jgi:hypothetical protein
VIARLGLVAGLLAALAVPAAPAGAQDSGARDRDNPTCPPLSTMKTGAGAGMEFRLETPGGRRVLVADGPVGLFTADRLKAALKENAPVEELWLNSPGGVASEGLAAGRLVHDLGVPTRVPATAWCASACNFIFLGGPIREVDPGGVFAVHMFTEVKDDPRLKQSMQDAYRPGGMERLVADIARIEQESAEIASQQNDFLIRMGVSRKLLTDYAYRQKSVRGGPGDSSTLRCLSPGEMRETNVVNVR